MKSSTKSGQTILHTVIALAAFAGSIVAPVIYVGDIKTTVAVQGNDISTLKESYKEVASDAFQAKTDASAVRAYLETLLKSRFLIDPKTIWTENGVVSLASTSSIQ